MQTLAKWVGGVGVGGWGGGHWHIDAPEAVCQRHTCQPPAPCALPALFIACLDFPRLLRRGLSEVPCPAHCGLTMLSLACPNAQLEAPAILVSGSAGCLRCNTRCHVQHFIAAHQALRPLLNFLPLWLQDADLVILEFVFNDATPESNITSPERRSYEQARGAFRAAAPGQVPGPQAVMLACG